MRVTEGDEGGGKEELGRKGLYICCHKSHENTFYSFCGLLRYLRSFSFGPARRSHTDTQTT